MNGKYASENGLKHIRSMVPVGFIEATPRLKTYIYSKVFQFYKGIASNLATFNEANNSFPLCIQQETYNGMDAQIMLFCAYVRVAYFVL